MSEDFEPRTVTLEGRHVRLEPLAPAHAADLLEAGADPETWRYMSRPHLRDLADTQAWIAAALEGMARGAQVAFAIVARASGRAVGSTQFFDIRRHDRAVEIGRTWLSPAARRTAINTECKYLLLRHAFEDLGAVRVQLKTDARNERSQRAIERIGAVREGVLRRHIVLWDGFIRDTVFYSIVDLEWPAVKLRLEGMLERR
jgi:N-acetyltransferase